MVQNLLSTNVNTEKNKKNKKKSLTKETVNVIRTTLRNNIDLTAIADNKANVLLSLNALMIAALVPMVLTNLDFIMERHLYIPLLLFGITCFFTIYLAAKALKPTDFDAMAREIEKKMPLSPFFFGNFYKMEVDEYFESIKGLLSDPDMVKAHLAQDLYYIGRRLGNKMTWIRKAFNIFVVGISLTLISLVIALVIG